MQTNRSADVFWLKLLLYALKIPSCHDANFVMAGGTVDSPDDNHHCHK